MLNQALFRQAREKVQMQKAAFVPAGDPTMGGDPAAAGGDPAMAGGDPAAAGGAPPAPAGGGDPMAALQPMIQQMVQQAVMASGGGGGGAGGGMEGGGIKPKIDVNVTLLQVLKILAKIADGLGIPIPASEMVATSGDLNQFAAQQQGAAPPQDPAAGGGAMGSIQPTQPMKAAAWENGTAFEHTAQNFDASISGTGSRSLAATALAMIARNREKARA